MIASADLELEKRLRVLGADTFNALVMEGIRWSGNPGSFDNEQRLEIRLNGHWGPAAGYNLIQVLEVHGVKNGH